MRVLITGAAGFFGGYFTRHLENAGHDVIATDTKFGTNIRDILRWGSYRSYDLVIHLASNVGGRANIDSAPLWIAENLSTDALFFQWCMENRPKRVVYFSSAAAYPMSLQARGYTNKLTEDMVCHAYLQEPDSLYGWAKVTGERLAALARKEGVPVTVVRPFSGYGPEQTLDYPFSSFIARALRRDNPFEIWGDGTQTRDWIHAEDVVGAVMALVEQEVDGPVNLCTGRATDFIDLFEMCVTARGYTAVPKFNKDAPQGPHYRVGDPALLLNYYTPKVAIEEGIERALAAS